jgi:hypothetical protein
VELLVSVQVVAVPSCVQEKFRRRRQAAVEQVVVVDVEFALRLVELTFVVVLLLMVTAKWPGQ